MLIFDQFVAKAVDGASPAQGEEFLTDPHDASTTVCDAFAPCTPIELFRTSAHCYFCCSLSCWAQSQEASKGGESEEEEDLFDLLM